MGLEGQYEEISQKIEPKDKEMENKKGKVRILRNRFKRVDS